MSSSIEGGNRDALFSEYREEARVMTYQGFVQTQRPIHYKAKLANKTLIK